MEQRLIDANAIITFVSAGHLRNPMEKTWSDNDVVDMIESRPTVDAVPVDFINQKIVELQSCANQHFNDGNEILATCVLETIRLLGSFLKEWKRKGERRC